MHQDSGSNLWGEMLDNIVTLLRQSEEEEAEKGQGFLRSRENEGSSATCFHLYGAGNRKEDFLKDVKDLRGFLVASLAELFALSPGKDPKIIRKSLCLVNQAALEQLCSLYTGLAL